MSRTETVQFNVRSAFARERAQELARRSGMTATQVVEEALRSFVPASAVATTGRLVQRCGILVKPAAGASITAEKAEAALEAIRERRDDD